MPPPTTPSSPRFSITDSFNLKKTNPSKTVLQKPPKRKYSSFIGSGHLPSSWRRQHRGSSSPTDSFSSTRPKDVELISLAQNLLDNDALGGLNSESDESPLFQNHDESSSSHYYETNGKSSHDDEDDFVKNAGNLRRRSIRSEYRYYSSRDHHMDESFHLHHQTRPSPSIWKAISSKCYAALLKIKRFIPLSPSVSRSAASINLSATPAPSQQIITRYDKKLRTINVFLSIFAFWGLFLMIVSNFINFSWWSPHHEMRLYFHIFDMTHTTQHEIIALGSTTFNILSVTYHTLHFVNFFNNSIVLFLLCLYYHTWSKQRRDEIGLASKLEAFFYGYLWPLFLLEWMCLIWCPIPFLELVVEFLPIELPLDGDELMLLMFLRFYLVFRLVRDFSPVYQKRHKIIASNPELRKTSSEFGWVLTLRLWLFSQTLTVLALAFSLILLVGTFCVWVTDREYNPDLTDPREALYFTMQTMGTIGYGTFAPSKRFASRCLAIGESLCGVVMVAFFSAVVINRLRPSEYQEAVAIFNSRENYVRKRLNEAVRILQIQFLYRKGKCSQAYWFENLRRSIKKLRHYKRKIAAFSEKSSSEEIVRNVSFSNVAMKEKVNNLVIIMEELKMSLEGRGDLERLM